MSSKVPYFVLIGISIAWFVYSSFTVPVTLTIPMHVTVAASARTVGFDTGTELITFGRLGGGSKSQRLLYLENNEKYAQKVRYSFSGDIGPWVSLLADYYYLDAGMKMEVPITLTVPRDAFPGNYTGDVTFFFSRS